MNKTGFFPTEIFLPKNADMTKWSVVACDQYTSEPDYWSTVEAVVGQAPSTLRLTLPECYLERAQSGNFIKEINRTMQAYLTQGVVASVGTGYIYVERTLKNGAVRHGLMGVVDLEHYDFSAGSQSLVRATEGTVLERIPPRVRVREDAALELPHVMVLLDDTKKTVLEPLAEQCDAFTPLYSFPLMMDSGSIKGWLLTAAAAAKVDAALDALAEQAAFDEKYGVQGKGVLLFAVGDGNHSLATAKTCYENLKKTLSPQEYQNHPARYALVEVVNVHDSALEFEPIHRVVFGVDSTKLLAELKTYYKTSEVPVPGQKLTYLTAQGEGALWVTNPVSNLPVGTLQTFLDDYTARYGGRIDYIHGDEVMKKLAVQPENIGFLLPQMEKSDLFMTVILDGALPRKTFSMGHAQDKRFYLESRRLKENN